MALLSVPWIAAAQSQRVDFISKKTVDLVSGPGGTGSDGASYGLLSITPLSTKVSIVQIPDGQQAIIEMVTMSCSTSGNELGFEPGIRIARLPNPPDDATDTVFFLKSSRTVNSNGPVLYLISQKVRFIMMPQMAVGVGGLIYRDPDQRVTGSCKVALTGFLTPLPD